jgi:SAM-dependent methyltransferase
MKWPSNERLPPASLRMAPTAPSSCGLLDSSGESILKRLLRRFSLRSRQRKFSLFHSLFHPTPQDRVLDVGVSGQAFLQYTLEDFYPYPDRIVGGGYDPREVASARRLYPQGRYVLFDGCSLPFPDKSFDIVFSNAVIEHVLGAKRQLAFAHEIMRVGKSWFVTTPNYWFPFESHYHLPFIQFLPLPLQRLYNQLLGSHVPRGSVQHLALLSASDLQSLFPTSQIIKVRVTFWPETLVAWYRDPNRKRPA